MEQKPKQIIVMRRDLKMPRGKIAAQASHASMACLLNFIQFRVEEDTMEGWAFAFPKNGAISQWLQGEFTKICVCVDSEAELEAVYTAAVDAGLNVSKIVDNGHTVFNGEKTWTCIGIGPDFPSRLDKVTGHLKLYN